MHKIAAAAAGGLLTALALVGCSSGGSAPAAAAGPAPSAPAAAADTAASLPPVDPQLVLACGKVQEAAANLATPDPIAGTSEATARLPFAEAADDLTAAGIRVPGFAGLTDDGLPGVPADPDTFHRAVSMMQRYCTDRGYRG